MNRVQAATVYAEIRAAFPDDWEPDYDEKAGWLRMLIRQPYREALLTLSLMYRGSDASGPAVADYRVKMRVVMQGVRSRHAVWSEPHPGHWSLRPPDRGGRL